MSTPIPYLPPVLETVNELLETKAIPALNGDEIAALTHYLFASADKPLRIQVAEIAYQNHEDPQAFDIFLACTIPLAKKMAERKATRIFIYPSDWQLECMYDGAVSALLTMYQRHATLSPIPDSFRRYLLRTIATGTVRDYFKRDEHCKIQSVENINTVAAPVKPEYNTVERQMITCELLEQVTNYSDLPPFVRKTLRCIAALGPDAALKEHAFTASGDPDKWKRQRGGTPILNPNAIAKARGVSKSAVHFQLYKARLALRQAFNADGRLFLTR